MRLAMVLGLMAVLVSPARAQAFGSCETGTAQRFLSNSFLQASVFNTGTLFFGGSTTSGDGYLTPKQNGTSSLFAASLWLGGLVEGEMRVAAARCGGFDFWPGPLENAANPPADCSEYDRIYLVSREDILRYYNTGELADDLHDWPYHLGAPVLDGDGDPTNYDLRAGDQPELIGDVAAWWVMNDAGNDHNPGAPLGVEVRVHAFVYGANAGPISPVLSQTSFYRYEIINRSPSTIEPMYATMWSDSDLGDAGDDIMGTDTLRNMVYVYNHSNEDANYGSPPPAQGIQLLSGPVGLANGRDDDFDGTVDEPGEHLGATSTITSFNAGPFGTSDPVSTEEYYNYIRGLWQDGSPITAMGFGYKTDGPITSFMLPGDPVSGAFWSATNSDGAGDRLRGGNRRILVSTGPFRLAPDSSVVLLYAMPYGQGTDHLNSVAVMRGYAGSLQRIATTGAFASSTRVPGTPGGGAGVGEDVPLTLTRVQPNPTAGPARAMLTLPEDTHVRATVLDALGRQLEVLVEGVRPEGDTELAMPVGLAPGTYLLRVEVPGAVETLTFTVVR
ncbi:MAG: hypothetical protein AAF170_01380 [Bacteroidota bacterium]